LIKNNINDFAVKSLAQGKAQNAKKSQLSQLDQKAPKESSFKINNKENHIDNAKDNSPHKNTEVYDLNQY
jgi:hypothetical protein